MAWISLAIASAFAQGNGIIGLYVCLIAVGYVLFMLFVVRPALSYVHSKLEPGDELNKSFLALILANLLLSAFFCEMLGIHSFFGSFVAGIVSPKSGKFVSELFPKIELVTGELLLPLFFASSGMRTNIGSVNSGFYGGVTVLIWALATLGKFIPACLVSKVVTKRDWRFCIGLGCLMNTRGLVELIALNIGLSLGILSPRLFTIFVIMALTTTFMTSPLLWIVYQRFYVDLSSSPALPSDTHNRLDAVRNADEKAIAMQPQGDQPIEIVTWHGGETIASNSPRYTNLSKNDPPKEGNQKNIPMNSEEVEELTQSGSRRRKANAGGA